MDIYEDRIWRIWSPEENKKSFGYFGVHSASLLLKNLFLILITSRFMITSSCWKSRTSYITAVSPFCYAVLLCGCSTADSLMSWKHWYSTLPLSQFCALLKTCWKLVCSVINRCPGFGLVLSSDLFSLYGSNKSSDWVWVFTVFNHFPSCKFVCTDFYLPYIEWKFSVCMSSLLFIPISNMTCPNLTNSAEDEQCVLWRLMKLNSQCSSSQMW